MRLIRRLDESTDANADSEHWYLVAGSYGLLGDHENSVRALRWAVERGFFNYTAMEIDPQFDSFRDDPEFQHVLEIAKQKHDAFRKKHADKLPDRW